MELEEIRKLKAELEGGILELIQQFTIKTDLYIREILLYGQLQVGSDKNLNVRVEVKVVL